MEKKVYFGPRGEGSNVSILGNRGQREYTKRTRRNVKAIFQE